MKKTIILGCVILAACSKPKQAEVITTSPDSQKTPNQPAPEICRSGNEVFNLSKRPYIQEAVVPDGWSGRKVTGGSGGTGGTGGTGTTTTPASVILLDFDGYTVSGTMWNNNGDIVCKPANLPAADINNIIERMRIDYSPFNINVTTDETQYYLAPVNRRVRIIVTESWEWFGQAGGTSYVGSFTWGNNTPGFVFSSLLSYNPKYIAESASHEAGHTLGLFHQSRYDANCVKLSEYNSGAGTGELSWAPIMGVGYYRNMTQWHNGPNTYACSNYQNDMSVIAAVTGLKNDDYGNNIASAATITGSATGILNSGTDADYFKLTTTTAKTIFLAPASVGTLNDGGNTDMTLQVYSGQGALLYTINNSATLDASIALPAGTYYLAASASANANAGSYGMAGRYNLSVL